MWSHQSVCGVQKLGRATEPSVVQSLTLPSTSVLTHSASFTSHDVSLNFQLPQLCSAYTTLLQRLKPRSMSWAATLSPRILSRFRRRPSSVHRQMEHVHMPIASYPRKEGGLRWVGLQLSSSSWCLQVLVVCHYRSPGSAPRAFDHLIGLGDLLVVKDGVQAMGKNGERVSDGQLVAATDTSGGAEWNVQLLSGATAGQDITMPRQSVEAYNG